MEAQVRHMVVFNLKYPKDSPEANQFIQNAKQAFEQIPSIQDMMQCYEVSPKNDYDYGFSFDFMTMADYEAYNNHPLHVEFVEKHWKTEVTKFLEIDLSEL